MHVTGQRADGYHELDSLVAFAEHGDDVGLRAAPTDALTLSGPFGADVPGGRENILLTALDRARPVLAAHGIPLGPVAIHLEKRLPVASGIGGGSADAAALLRLVAAGNDVLLEALRTTALALGADVPMCLSGRPCRVGGIGEAIRPVAAFPEAALVLVNPGTPVSTPAVFRALARRDNPAMPEPPVRGFCDTRALAAYLVETRNDLEAPALSIAPAIDEVREALGREGALFARMSGSGATVFGLFDGAAQARRAAETIARREPGWWVVASRLRAACVPALDRDAP